MKREKEMKNGEIQARTLLLKKQRAIFSSVSVFFSLVSSFFFFGYYRQKKSNRTYKWVRASEGDFLCEMKYPPYGSQKKRPLKKPRRLGLMTLGSGWAMPAAAWRAMTGPSGSPISGARSSSPIGGARSSPVLAPPMGEELLETR